MQFIHHVTTSKVKSALLNNMSVQGRSDFGRCTHRETSWQPGAAALCKRLYTARAGPMDWRSAHLAKLLMLSATSCSFLHRCSTFLFINIRLKADMGTWPRKLTVSKRKAEDVCGLFQSPKYDGCLTTLHTSDIVLLLGYNSC